MVLKLSRLWRVTTATVGVMTVDDDPEGCFTLEEPMGDGCGKAPFAILPGTYQIKMQPSQRFGRPMPHLLNVPDRTAIEIHDGDTERDTHGCILVGNVRLGADSIGDSRRASDALNKQIQAAQDRDEEVTLEIAA